MTVEQADVIDYVSVAEGGDLLVLTMLEERDLVTPGLIDQTLVKINFYLRAITSGLLTQVDGYRPGMKVRVQYNVLENPQGSPELVHVLQAAADLCTRLEIDFTIVHLNVWEASPADVQMMERTRYRAATGREEPASADVREREGLATALTEAAQLPRETP